MRRALHGAVLRTRKVPGLEALYRGVYRGAARAAAQALAAVPGVTGVYLHRGLTRDGWEPGVSDIDLVVVKDGGPARESEARFLARLAERVALLRGLVPMLGDLWVGEPAELDAYLRRGGLRAWEDAPDWKLLAGRPIPLPELDESAPKRRYLDPWAWLFVSHMELSRRALSREDGGPKAAADARKLWWDARRYADFIVDEALKAPRSRVQERERAPSLSMQRMWLDSSERLERASRRVLDACGAAGFAVPPIPVSAEARGASVLDRPYHRYVLVGAGARPADYRRAAESVSLAEGHAAPLVLGPASWALCLQSAYLGAPLGWLGCGGGGGPGASSGPFRAWETLASGPLAPVPLLPSGLRRECAAEAFSWMSLWWRALWISPAMSNRFVLHHLMTRAMGLRLELAGKAPGPYCHWELSAALLSAASPGLRRPVASLRSYLLEAGDAALDSSDRNALPCGLLGALSRLL